jgi:hypothetical protein
MNDSNVENKGFFWCFFYIVNKVELKGPARQGFYESIKIVFKHASNISIIPFLLLPCFFCKIRAVLMNLP